MSGLPNGARELTDAEKAKAHDEHVAKMAEFKAVIAASLAKEALEIETRGGKRHRYGVGIVEYAGEFENQAIDPSDAYLIDGLIPENVPMVIAGHPKSRKSWLMYVFAIMIASGKSPWGLQVKRGKVLIIGREDTHRETARRLWRVARGMGIDLRDLDGWLEIETAEPLRLDVAEDCAHLRGKIFHFEPAITFIDCLSRLHTQKEKDASSMAPVTNAWADLSSDCTICIVHHYTKAGEGSLFQRMRGSGDLGAVVRFGIGVEKRGQNGALIETDGNLEGGSEPFALEFVDGEDAGGNLMIRVEYRSGKVLKQDAAQDAEAKRRDRVLELVQDGTTTTKAIRKALKVRADVSSKTVNALIRSGEICRDGDKNLVMGRGRPRAEADLADSPAGFDIGKTPK